VTSAQPRQRPITRADLEAKLGEIRDATEGGERARNLGLVIGVVAVGILVVGAFVLGSRRGKRRRTIVEVRRV
jgi:hypothetical protein